MTNNNRFYVDPKVAGWVMRHSDFDNLSDEDKEQFLLWRSGVITLTIKEIEELSDAINIPRNYLYLKEIPVEEVPLLTLTTTKGNPWKRPSRALTTVLLELACIQNDVSKTRERQEASFCGLVGGGTGTREHPEVIARKILSYLGLGDVWRLSVGSAKRCRKLVAQLVKHRVLVIQGDEAMDFDLLPDPSECRAFVMLDDYAPLIFVNPSDNADQQLFALVHEVVHIWLGTSELFDGTNQPEQAFRDPIFERQAYAITYLLVAGSLVRQ